MATETPPSPPSPAPAGPKRSRVAPYVAGAVAVVLIALVVVLATRKSATDQLGDSPLLGKTAPALDGETLDGGTYALADHAGAFVFVNFFASWCAPCQQEMPELAALDGRYKDSGEVSLVSVVFQDKDADVTRFMADNGGTWPVLKDASGQTAAAYGVVKLPESYLIAPDGTVIAKFFGGVKVEQVAKVVDQAMGRSK